jgi:hypothetical protein
VVAFAVNWLQHGADISLLTAGNSRQACAQNNFTHAVEFPGSSSSPSFRFTVALDAMT